MEFDGNTVLMILTIVSYIITFAKMSIDRARDNQQVKDQLKELSKRVDSHNRYAEMFREYGEDIAFIRGQLEK